MKEKVDCVCGLYLKEKTLSCTEIPAEASTKETGDKCHLCCIFSSKKDKGCDVLQKIKDMMSFQ